MHAKAAIQATPSNIRSRGASDSSWAAAIHSRALSPLSARLVNGDALMAAAASRTRKRGARERIFRSAGNSVGPQ